jgi:hypothetical protein
VLTLWDLIRPRKRAASPEKTPIRRRIGGTGTGTRTGAVQARYDAMVRDELARYAIRVRKWRTSMTGVAWIVKYHDGREARLIEAPRPKGPMSAAIFLHEIGHHAIGFHTYSPRCLEEYQAWSWALREMERLGLNVTDSVRARMHDSLHYAIQKANRRGLKRLPAELEPFTIPRKRVRRLHPTR